jgi:hypothetical protein
VDGGAVVGGASACVPDGMTCRLAVVDRCGNPADPRAARTEPDGVQGG